MIHRENFSKVYNDFMLKITSVTTLSKKLELIAYLLISLNLSKSADWKLIQLIEYVTYRTIETNHLTS